MTGLGTSMTNILRDATLQRYDEEALEMGRPRLGTGALTTNSVQGVLDGCT